MDRCVNPAVKMAVAGHICLDITPSFSNKETDSIGELLTPGQLLQVGRAEVSTGGAVANTGLALKILGADVLLMGKIGNDSFGRLILERIRAYGAEKGMILSEEADTSYSVVLAPEGTDRIFLHHSGANDMFYKKDLDFSLIREVQLFHFGYPPLMKSMYENEGRELVNIFRTVKGLGVLTSLDMASVDGKSPAAKADWDGILKRVLPFVDFFVPSVEELAFMIDRERYHEWKKRAGSSDVTAVLNMEKDVHPLAEKLMAYGAGIVLIKCGALGMFLATAHRERLEGLKGVLSGGAEVWAERRVFEESFVPDRILSGTGAGDSSIAAFLYAVVTGHSYQECLQLAAATGASCVTAYDALSGLKSFDELKTKIRSGWKKSSQS